MQEITRFIYCIPVDHLTGAVSVPIYQTSTFVQEAPGVNYGCDYARSNNPTRAVLESLIASLESGLTGLAFATGLAAVDAVLKLLQSGDEVVAVDDIYAGAFRLFEQVYKKFGLIVPCLDASFPVNVLMAITPKPRLIWIETPSNPTLKIAEMTHKAIPPERRRAGGVNDSLIRLSAGPEEPEDLIRDLCNSLDRIVVKKNVYSQKSETC